MVVCAETLAAIAELVMDVDAKAPAKASSSSAAAAVLADTKPSESQGSHVSDCATSSPEQQDALPLAPADGFVADDTGVEAAKVPRKPPTSYSLYFASRRPFIVAGLRAKAAQMQLEVSCVAFAAYQCAMLVRASLPLSFADTGLPAPIHSWSGGFASPFPRPLFADI